MRIGPPPSGARRAWGPAPKSANKVVMRRWAEIATWPIAAGLLACWSPEAPTPEPPPPPPPPPAAEVVTRAHAAMGTLFEVVAVGETAAAEQAIEEAFAEIRRVEELLSTWDPAAPLARVNDAAGGGPVPIAAELLDVLEECQTISGLTGGAFDVSFASMGKIWDFRAETPALPTAAEVARGIALIDYREIELDRRASTARLRRKGMRVSLGAIAKGYAADRAAAVLRRAGFDDFAVYGSGDVLVSGTRGGRPWTVGIPDPRSPNRNFASVSWPAGGAVVTSGDYQSYFEMSGKRYHHIIDPRTGFPAAESVSVTVVAPSAARADGLATGLFVMGPARGMALVEQDPQLEAVFVDSALQVTVSTGLRPHVEVRPIRGTKGGDK